MNPATRVNYDEISPTYHQRYQARALVGVAACLHDLAGIVEAESILEVGCGTGRWLEELKATTPHLFGLDLSLGMLRQAGMRGAAGRLVCGEAGTLPLAHGSFDLVFCVNAFHHFPDKARFIHEAHRLLRPGGALGIIGMDPHRGRDRWYVYDYFESTYETDLRRFPSSGQLLDWMAEAGFQQAEWGVAERIYHPMSGEEVLEDPFLMKNGTSQLALLSERDYAQGMDRIRAALRSPNKQSQELTFPVDIELVFIHGWKGRRKNGKAGTDE